MLTLSIIKADTGGWVGHSAVHPDMVHGPFEPHRLPLDEMEYTTMPAVAARLADRWEPFQTASSTPQPALVGDGKPAAP